MHIYNEDENLVKDLPLELNHRAAKPLMSYPLEPKIEDQILSGPSLMMFNQRLIKYGTPLEKDAEPYLRVMKMVSTLEEIAEVRRLADIPISIQEAESRCMLKSKE
jgi:hypothetical protein